MTLEESIRDVGDHFKFYVTTVNGDYTLNYRMEEVTTWSLNETCDIDRI